MERVPFLLAGLVACTGANVTDSAATDASGPTDASTADTGAPPPNLLVNAAAERCTLEAWTADTKGTIDAVMTQDQGSSLPNVTPAQGDCFFSFAAGALPKDTIVHRLSQRGPATVGTVLRLSGQVQNAPADYATVTVVPIDGGGMEMMEVPDTRLADSKTWSVFELDYTVPEGAAEWMVVLSAHLEDGSFSNVFFDDLQLVERPTE